ncbi:hypothetical protein Bca101_058496 [Brassica carinata]
MKPVQHGGQDDQISSTMVHPSDRTRQTGRAVYRIDPRASRKELRLDPRSDDRSDHPTDRLLRPSRHSKDDSRARYDLGCEDAEDVHAFSLLIHQLSEDLGHVWTRLVRDVHPTSPADSPLFVLLLTAVHTAWFDEPGQ